MKSFFFVLATVLASSTQALALNADCRVTELYNDSFLEESLSVEEYPEIRVSDDEIGLGSSVYSTADGDRIQILLSDSKQAVVTVTHASGAVQFGFKLNHAGHPKTGQLWGQNRGEDATLIADLLCK